MRLRNLPLALAIPRATGGYVRLQALWRGFVVRRQYDNSAWPRQTTRNAEILHALLEIPGSRIVNVARSSRACDSPAATRNWALTRHQPYRAC